ncbi:MAG: hypothetical protein AAB337_01325, partial [Patescibacteria group bacterium]
MSSTDSVSSWEKLEYALHVAGLAIGFGAKATGLAFVFLVLGPAATGLMLVIAGVWWSVNFLILLGAMLMVVEAMYLWTVDRLWDMARMFARGVNPARRGGLIDSLLLSLIRHARGEPRYVAPSLSRSGRSRSWTIAAAMLATMGYLNLTLGLLVTGALVDSIKWWMPLILGLIGLAVVLRIITSYSVLGDSMDT